MIRKYVENHKMVYKNINLDVPRCYDIRNIDGVNYDTVVKH
jgi:hypothetical protein